MSFTNETNRVDYDGDNSTTEFSFSFKVLNETDMRIFVGGVLQTITTHYSVSINTTSEGGSITFVTAPPVGSGNVIIKRTMDFQQNTDIPTESNFPEEQIENALDKSRMLDVQTKEEIGRCLKFAETSTFKDIDCPDPEANKMLVWNSLGTALINATVSEFIVTSGFLASANNLSDLPSVPTALANLTIDPFGLMTEFSINDSEAGPTDVTGMTVDGSTYSSALFLIEVKRGTNRFMQLVSVVNVNGTWQLYEGPTFGPNDGDHGVTLTVATSGGDAQVKYASDNSGAGLLKFKKLRMTDDA